MGTETVDVSMYAVVTHAYIDSPWSCSMMRGIAVETIVWSSALSSTTTARAASVSRRSLEVTTRSVNQLTGLTPAYCFFLPVHLPSPNEPNTTVPLIVSPVTVPV